MQIGKAKLSLKEHAYTLNLTDAFTKVIINILLMVRQNDLLYYSKALSINNIFVYIQILSRFLKIISTESKGFLSLVLFASLHNTRTICCYLNYDLSNMSKF